MTSINRFVGMLAGLCVSASAPATAATGGMIMFPASDAAPWRAAPASLPRGIAIAILSGNPDLPGPFTLRLRLPADTVIKPHTHATAESVTVLSGGIVHETGQTLEKSRGSRIAAGGFVYLPADMPHSLWTTSAVTDIQVTGTGPFGLHYIDPADDPSRR